MSLALTTPICDKAQNSKQQRVMALLHSKVVTQRSILVSGFDYTLIVTAVLTNRTVTDV